MTQVKLKKNIRYALCSCNQSAKYPFCDGAHRKHNALNKSQYKSIKIICKTDTELMINP